MYQNRTNSPQTVNVHMETSCLKGGYAEHVDTNGRGKHLFDLWGSGSTAVSTVLQPGQSIHAGCGVAAKGDGCCVFDIEVPGTGQRCGAQPDADFRGGDQGYRLPRRLG